MAIRYAPRIVTDNILHCSDVANPLSYISGSGNTIIDISGNGHDLITAYNPQFSYDYGGIFSYDGINQYATATSVGVTNCTDPFSMGIWVRIPSSATWTNGYFGTILGTGASYSGQYGLIRTQTDSQIGFYVRGQTGDAGAYGYISKDVWYYIAGVWTGTIAYLYVNGVRISTSSGTLTGTWDSTNVSVALARAYSGAYGNYMEGDVGPVQYYTKALSHDEVFQNYKANRGRFGV